MDQRQIVEPQRRAINLRSVTLGALGVVLICGLTPYNNYAMNNTDLVGNFLPTGLLLLFAVFVMTINALLCKLARKYAFGSHELAVALAMTLVSCTLPAGGLMRYLPANIVGITWQAQDNADYSDMLQSMHLPNWIFPHTQSQDFSRRGREEVYRRFLEPTHPPDSFIARWRRVPWGAWITPAITWGILVAAIYGAVLSLMAIFRKQWVDNERLPFPIASIYLSLIETPPPGKSYNTLFRSKSFWISFGVVFILHALNSLNKYNSLVPAIPIHFDLRNVLSNPPLGSMSSEFKVQTIYFTVVGITYFIQARVAFSLWFFYVLLQVVLAFFAQRQAEYTGGMQTDEFFGAFILYVGAMLWLARKHLLVVARQMIHRPGTSTPVARYLPYGVAGWVLLTCLLTMVIWLICAGTTVIGGMVLVALMMGVFLAVARIVAETGLLYVMLPVPLGRGFVYAANDLPVRLQQRTTLSTYFFGTLFGGVFTHDIRQSLPVYASHAMRVTDAHYDLAKPGNPQKTAGIGLMLCLAASLLAGYLISGAGMLYVQYNVPASLDTRHEIPLNGWGTQIMPQWVVLGHTHTWVPPSSGPIERHNRLGHFALGAGIMGTLSIFSIRLAGWPLHPIGYLLMTTLGIQWVWFSIFLGWLAKTMVLRLGGAGLFRRSRNFFLGMVMGEAGAAAFWLVVSLVVHLLGGEYIAIQVLLT